jgi:hypothetical protein
MRELISLRAFGLSEIEAVRYYVAPKMADRGLVSAPNMAVGESFNIGITTVQPGAAAGVPGHADLAGNGGAVTPGVTQVAAQQLISRWQADRVPPSTRDQPFPAAADMEPIRRAERLVKSIEDIASSVRGLPLLNQDKVWDRVRRVGLDELRGLRDVMADRQRHIEVS